MQLSYPVRSRMSRAASRKTRPVACITRPTVCMSRPTSCMSLVVFISASSCIVFASSCIVFASSCIVHVSSNGVHDSSKIIFADTCKPQITEKLTAECSVRLTEELVKQMFSLVLLMQYSGNAWGFEKLTIIYLKLPLKGQSPYNIYVGGANMLLSFSFPF